MIIRQSMNTPWKIWNELECWLTYPCVRLLFGVNHIPWGRNWRFHGAPIIHKHRRSWMQFGPGLQLRSSLRSNPLGPNHPVFLTTWLEDSRLDVGANFAMTGGVLCAAEHITIGDNVAIGANTIVVDTDFHPLNYAQRQARPGEAKTAPVWIDHDVFIGMNCQILKGVSIGCGSVVGAGSVVTRDIPPHVIAAGNPAQVVRELS